MVNPMHRQGPITNTVLVVDDTTETREMLQVGLELHGYQVDIAGDVCEALAALTTHTYGAVVTDMCMPNRSGADFIRIVRGQPRTAKLPIILMSSGDVDTIPADMASEPFIRKPFGFESLVHLLNAYRCAPAGAERVLDNFRL